jgi:hypothetical protein
VERLTHLALDVVRWGHIAVDASNAAHVTELQDRIRVAMRRARETQAEERPLLLRVTISGQTALHGALQDVAAALRDDVRGIAAETAADLWIEKVEVRTAPPATASPLQDTDDIRALLAAADPSLATALQAEFMPFLAGLPAPEPGSLLRAAADGDWGQIIDIAGAALQTRLGTEG